MSSFLRFFPSILVGVLEERGTVAVGGGVLHFVSKWLGELMLMCLRFDREELRRVNEAKQ